MLRSLVGSEMCIRDRYQRRVRGERSERMQLPPPILNYVPQPNGDTREAMSIYKRLDMDGNGILSWEEIYRGLHDFGLSDQQIEEFFLSVDTNHSQDIDVAEFCAAFARFRHFFHSATPKEKLEFWYRCPSCTQMVINNTGSDLFGCPHCHITIQGVAGPNTTPLVVQQTTQCTNPACKTTLIVPSTVQNGSCYAFACPGCGQVMTANQAPSQGFHQQTVAQVEAPAANMYDQAYPCLLYTSDAADEEDSVDLGGRRIIKKKKNEKTAVKRIVDK
eukprot:TRINITY_DN12706_c0_g2_i1.p1 TRINITY_DN12706_c0_g2~~TRINITY_DN12706_c0_g2_i1.p1  ORF type:complete len:275 (-),score=65.81 TRINITY_DN12706_c0_g2_i1:56-880(-)